MGKLIAERWRNVDPEISAGYETMAERDAERYRDELEEYYRNRDAEVIVACIAGGRSDDGRMGAIEADGGGGGAALGRGSSRCGTSMFPRAITPCSSRETSLGAASAASSNSSEGGGGAGGVGGGQLVQPTRGARKTFLQVQLAQKRSELLSDITSLNEIATSRIATGKPAFKQDAAVVQRLYNLAVGPGGGSMFAGGRSNALDNGCGGGNNAAGWPAFGTLAPSAAAGSVGIGGIGGTLFSSVSSRLGEGGKGGLGGKGGGGGFMSEIPMRPMTAMNTGSTVTIERLDPSPASSRSNSLCSLGASATNGGSAVSNGGALAAEIQARLMSGSPVSSSSSSPAPAPPKI